MRFGPKLEEIFLSASRSFSYLSGTCLKAINPSFLTPKFSRKNKKCNDYLHFSVVKFKGYVKESVKGCAKGRAKRRAQRQAKGSADRHVLGLVNVDNWSSRMFARVADLVLLCSREYMYGTVV